MGFRRRGSIGLSDRPCDLADILGAPDLLAPAELAQLRKHR
jgi:hypothetical protein